MENWALIVDGLVREIVTINPEGRYHPDLVWVPCAPDVREQWIYNSVDNTFTSNIPTP